MNTMKKLASIASAMALGTLSCNIVERPAAESEKPANELSIAARQIGSTQPVTLISTLAQLRAMNTAGNYRLANNINASATATTPFVPIGGTKDPFQGTFDGNNFTISNLTITGGVQTGMFSWAVNADFKNIRLTNVNVTGGGSTGALAGFVRNVDLKNSYVTGTVKGWGKNVGGLIGYLVGGDIQNVSVVGSVTGRHAAGGLLGHVVNNEANSKPSILRGAISRAIVTDAAAPNRAGTIGTSTGTFAWFQSFWDNQADGGTPNPGMPEPWCQTGKSSNQLKAPTLTAPKLLNPYFFGSLVTQAMVNSGDMPACALGSGTDGDRGFGTCGITQVWAANSSTEYNTLTRIPNPGVQPK